MLFNGRREIRRLDPKVVGSIPTQCSEYPRLLGVDMTDFETGSNFLRRNNDPDTSHAAAESIDTTMLETVVLSVIKQFPNGCIGADVVRALPGWGIETISPRYAALLRKKLIVDTGERRIAPSGRGQRVMAVAPLDKYAHLTIEDLI